MLIEQEVKDIINIKNLNNKTKEEVLIILENVFLLPIEKDQLLNYLFK